MRRLASPTSQQLRAHWLDVVLLLFALSLSVLVIVTTRWVTSGEQLTRARHLVTQLDREQVTAITVEQGGQRWRVEHIVAPHEEESRWKLTEPLQGDAEEATLDGLLRAAQFAKWLREVEPTAVDRVGFGLDEPEAVLGIEQGALSYRLRVGSEAPAPQGARYVEVAGEGVPNKGVYVVSESTAADLTPDPDDLRIRQIIPYAGSALASIQANVGESVVRLVRGERDEFRFSGSFGDARVARVSLEQLLAEFSRVVAERFLDVDSAQTVQAAAQQEMLRLELTPRIDSRDPAVITIGGTCPDDPELVIAVRAAPRPTAACVKRTQVPQIFRQPEWLVDHQLFQMRFDEIERLSITQGEQRLELARRGDGFSMLSPENAEVESELVEQRFGDALELRGKLVEQPSLAELGLDAPARTVTLMQAGAEDDPTAEVLQIGVPRADGSVFVRRQVDGAVLRFTTEALRGFEADGLLLKKRSLVDLAARDVASLAVEHAGVRWLLVQPSPATFRLDQPRDVRVDSSLAVEWIEAVRQLEALRWVSSSDDGSFGLATPHLRFELHTAEGKVLGVSVGNRAPRGYYAKADGDAGVFLISRSVVDTLTMLILDRSGFTLDPDTATQIVVNTGNASIELERVGREFVARSESGLSPSDVRALLDALALVRPEAAISFDAIRGIDFAEPLLDVKYSFERDGELVQRHWQVGVGDSYRGSSVYLARLVGGRVTYAIPRQLVSRVLDVL